MRAIWSGGPVISINKLAWVVIVGGGGDVCVNMVKWAAGLVGME